MKNPYEVLGLDKTATEEDIKKAWRKAASTHHPDKNPGAEAESKFKEVNEAWQILSDPEKKARFDLTSGRFEPPPYRDTSRIHEEFVEEMFRQGYRGRVRHDPIEDFGQVVPGEDMEASVVLTLEEAIAGCRKELRVQSEKPVSMCVGCGGLGAARGTTTMDCNSCDGSGKSRGIGRSRSCPACKGIGKKHVVPCHHCGGKGRVPFVRELRVTIPSGVDTGDRLRLAGQGVPGRNSSPGDLFVTTFVQEHPRFKRQKKDLICCATLDALDVMEGTVVSIQRLDGTSLDVEVPAGFCTAAPIVVRGEGVPTVTEAVKGNLQLTLNVRMPTMTSPKSRILLEELIKELKSGK